MCTKQLLASWFICRAHTSAEHIACVIAQGKQGMPGQPGQPGYKVRHWGQ